MTAYRHGVVSHGWVGDVNTPITIDQPDNKQDAIEILNTTDGRSPAIESYGGTCNGFLGRRGHRADRNEQHGLPGPC